MDSMWAIDLARNAIFMTLLVSGPILLTAMFVGIVVSLLQAVTQIQEQAISFVFKLFALGAVSIFGMPWAFRTLAEYLAQLLEKLPELAQ